MSKTVVLVVACILLLFVSPISTMGPAIEPSGTTETAIGPHAEPSGG